MYRQMQVKMPAMSYHVHVAVACCFLGWCIGGVKGYSRILNGQSYVSCDMYTECPAVDVYGGNSISTCTCFVPVIDNVEMGGMIRADCQTCSSGMFLKRCGCFQASVFNFERTSSLCSIGICLERECGLDMYPWMDDIMNAGDITYTNTRDNTMTFQGMTWAARCRPCDSCAPNEMRTARCNSITQNVSCQLCPAGSYCDGVEKHDCDAGSYCPAGSSMQIPCDPAKAQICPRASMSAPEAGCPAGQYYLPGICTSCPLGTYLESDGPHTRLCFGCDRGYSQSSHVGATSHNDCTACQPGFYAPDYGWALPCAMCQVGTYQSLIAGTMCHECQAGQYGTSTVEECKTCGGGTYSPNAKSTTCTKCAVGSYNNKIGQSACTECAWNQSTCTLSRAGQTSQLQCTSGAATNLCDYCPPGYVVCDPRVGDQCTGLDRHDCMVCPDKFYCPGENQRIRWTIVQIGYQFMISEGTTTTDLVLQKCGSCNLTHQYIERDCERQQDILCHECQKPVLMKTQIVQACSMHNDTVLIKCTNVTQVAGEACNPCLPGTRKLLQGGCEVCPPNTYSENPLNGVCTACMDGRASGRGASWCTRVCDSGMIAPDGSSCQSKQNGVERVVGLVSRIPELYGCVWLVETAAVVVVDNRGSNTGLLWMLTSNNNNMEWLVAGGGKNEGRRDGRGGVASFGYISALVPEAGGGYLVGESTSGSVRRMTYIANAMAFDVETVVMLPGKEIGGLLSLADSGIIMFTDLVSHSVWEMDRSGQTILQVRGGGGSKSIGLNDPSSKGRFSRPTSLARDDNWIMVLDEFGIWKFDMTVLDMYAIELVCGGGDVSSWMYTNEGYQSVLCSHLDLANLEITSMTSGVIRGESSIIFACNKGVVYVGLKDRFTHVLTPPSSSLSATYMQVVWWMDGSKLLATKCQKNGGGCSVVEIGTDECQCDAGLYCDAQTSSYQCMQAGVGTYAPSWTYGGGIPCKVGTVGTGPGKATRSEGCTVYGGGQFTTYEEGAVNLRATCGGGDNNNNKIYYNHLTGECVPGCDTAAGEYMQEEEGICKICPRGSKPSTARSSCVPCEAGTFAEADGICTPCMNGGETLFQGAFRCMGSTDCADGGLDCTNDRTWELGDSGDLTKIIISDVQSIGNSIYVASTHALWQIMIMMSGGNSMEELVAGDSMFGMIQVDDDETFVYSSALGGKCIYKVALDTGAMVSEFAGQCRSSPGDMDGVKSVATFSNIQSIAYMHVDGSPAVLFVSATTTGCAGIRAISLFDGSVSTFSSFDYIRGNRYTMSSCILTGGLKLKAIRGTDILYYYHDDLGIQKIHNDGVYIPEEIYPVGNYPVKDMCVKQGSSSSSDAAGWILGLLVKNTISGTSPQQQYDELRIMSESSGSIEAAISNNNAIMMGKAVECAGLRYWVGQGRILTQKIISGQGGCLGGYAPNANGMCMQLGLGQYSLPNGGFANCKGGTRGTKAGAWSHVFCEACPDGSISQEGAFECQTCPAERSLSSKDGTECVSSCPAGTYWGGAAGSANKCSSCPAGWSSSAGARTIAECFMCSKDTFSNAQETQGICQPCATGWTSHVGSHHCVIICKVGECAIDGQTCIEPTEKWKMLTSIQIMGGAMQAVTVGPNGCVFYSDGNSLSYFQDDCTGSGTVVETSVCERKGLDLMILSQFFTRNKGISALALDQNLIGPSYMQRYLYVGSITMHCIYRIPITFKAGAADVEAIRLYFTRNNPWAGVGSDFLRIGRCDDSGFADGSFAEAKFDMPVEVEISSDGGVLYISDFNNHRIRVADLRSQRVTTLVGNGVPCWRTGAISYCPSSSVPKNQATLGMNYCDARNGCATARNPLGIGLSVSNDALYIAMYQDNAVGVIQMNEETPRLSQKCLFNPSLVKNTVETCDMSKPGSRSCFIWKPFDVVAHDKALFVSVTNGITRIDLDSLDCRQVSGAMWDWNQNSSKGDVDGEVSISRVFNPFKMVLSYDVGIMYVADMNNGAVKRIFVGGKCICAEGTMYMDKARACYNPSERWSSRMLIHCTQPGYFALEGDTTCRSCREAFAAGLYVANCAVWAQTSSIQDDNMMIGYPFSKVVSDPMMKPLRHGGSTGDWYGISTPPKGNNRQWNDIFNDNVMHYRMMGAGHAPKGNMFVSLLYQVESGLWLVARDPLLEPQLMLPGLWYPCADDGVDTNSRSCDCSKVETSFGKSGWQDLREFAMRGKGQAVIVGGVDLTDERPLKDYAQGLEVLNRIQGWSRFMALGQGPSFSVMEHMQEKVLVNPERVGSARVYTLRLGTADKLQGGGDTCYVGWPAHYACPQGFVWVAPSLYKPVKEEVAEAEVAILDTITCLSCLPGTHSGNADAQAGGPYACLQCDAGTYSSGVASSTCELCPDGTYASGMGSTTCSLCPANYFTNPGAQSLSACNPCAPGTGKCDACVPGYRQTLAAQYNCTICEPGSVSNVTNAIECTPCPKGTHQARAGMQFCDMCPPLMYTAQEEGATDCSLCLNKDCRLAIGGVCGQGCGLNHFWDEDAQGCLLCDAGTLNTDEPCAMSREACWHPQGGKYWSAAQHAVLDCPSGYGPNSTLNGCVGCPGGTHYVDKRGCVPCMGGQYSVESGQTMCLDCPAGTSSPAVNLSTSGVYLFAGAPVIRGYTECQLCEKGHFAAGGGVSVCLPCRPGTYATMRGMTTCTKCAKGTMSAIEGNSVGTCATCNEEQQMYSGEGASSCTLCTDGNITAHDCVGCGVGMYARTGQCIQCNLGLVNLWETRANDSSYCKRCPVPIAYAAPSGDHCINSSAGFVPTADGRGSQKCGVGTYRGENDTQTATCLPCPAGTFTATEGSSECIACYKGMYMMDTGSTACHQCTEGVTVALGRGSTSCGFCDPGYMASDDGASCVQCNNNTYSTGSGVACHSCDFPTPFAFAGSSECTTCPEWTAFIIDRCQTCPVGAYMVYIVDTMMGPDGGYYQCISCGLNTVNPHKASRNRSDCVGCTDGYVPNAEKSQCVTCGDGLESLDDILCQECKPGDFSNAKMAKCSHCPAGQYSSASGSKECKPCEEGTYSNVTTGGVSQCQQCVAGTFSNVTGARKCLECERGTFADQQGSAMCANRTLRCPMGMYVVNHIDKPEQDNECQTCDPCRVNEVMVTKTDQYWGGGSEVNNLMNPSLNPALCPGDSMWKLYDCVNNDPEAGFFFVGKMAGASSDGETEVLSAVRMPCKDLENSPGSDVLLAYVAGPVNGCFLGCKYGIKTDGVQKYYYESSHTTTSMDKDIPWNNVFYPLVIGIADSVCRPCSLVRCPLGTFRPKITDTCGPACGLVLAAGHAAEECTGCSGQCRPPKTGQVIVDGSIDLGNDECPWVCAKGWHRTETDYEADGCRECSAENPDTFCWAGYVLVPPQECFPTSRKQELCKKCENVTGGKAKAWNNQTQECTYECLAGHFALDASHKACPSCSAYNDEECPIGTFRDVMGCLERGTAPLCIPCLVPSDLESNLFSFTTNGGNSSRNCSALCRTGMHSLTRDTNQYVWDLDSHAIGTNVFNLRCEPCNVIDNITCHGHCAGGQFRNSNVSNGLTGGACQKCTMSKECGAGRYAALCGGNESANVGCMRCSSQILYDPATGEKVREFVSYDLVKDSEKQGLMFWEAGSHCPSVCIPNYARVVYGEGMSARPACVACASLVKSLGCEAETRASQAYASGQPRPCEFVYSHWNATPALMWWDVVGSFTPSFIPYTIAKASVPVSRAGLCWACPMGEGTIQGDTDLCVLQAGYGRSGGSSYPIKMEIPALSDDIYVSMQEPVMPYVDVATGRRRQLLQEVDASSMMSGAAVAVVVGGRNVQCPVGYYKPNRGDGPCFTCPHGMSTYSKGASSVAECVCLPGWSPNSKEGGCTPCPEDTYRPFQATTTTLPSLLSACLPCPVNETTFGRINSSKCSCRQGLMRLNSGECVPCRANTSCRPCRSDDVVCPPSRVITTPCFSRSSSPEGSQTIENCTCDSGLVALRRPSSSSSSSSPDYYCMDLPPMAVYDKQQRSVHCKVGWTARWSPNGQILEACTLCPAGQYAAAIEPLLTCIECPIGTFSGTQDAIGGCTRCPHGLSTVQRGSKSLKDCGCPAPMVAKGDVCTGCRLDEYSEGGQCKTCPLFSMSQAGGSSLKDCQCKRGYFMLMPEGVCQACPLGMFSGHVGMIASCTLCPEGSSTETTGSESIRQCSKCWPGYVWRDKVGCILQTLVEL